ncbi:hypothetical protein [Formosa sp. S-31]|uniref:hypothetical protein n=1 Tax=Formosa sp. S-31 TaxID=2790949 RepID=UPI003EBB1D62
MNITCKRISFMLLLLVSFALQAQEITMPSADFSKDLLSTLKPGNDLGITSDVASKLESENQSFVSDVVDIMGSSDDDATKKLKINNRKNERDNALGKVFGSDDALKSYKKKIKKEMKPFKRKYKLATLIF